MELAITQEGNIELKNVFNPIELVTASGEKMAIVMRDSGFEFWYEGEWYFAKEGYVEPFHKSVRDNYLVSELQHHVEEKTIPCINL